MNNLPQEKTIIVNKPQRHAGVYAILNILEKQVYIGETIDFYHRIPEHIIGILENSDNENLLNAQTHNFEIFVLLDMVDTYAKNKKNEYSQEQLWLFHETLYMYLFRTYGFKLYNKVGHDNDKRSFLNNSYDNLDELYHGLQKYCQEKNIPEEEISKEKILKNGKTPLLFLAKNQLEKDFKNYYNVSISAISTLSHIELQKIWKNRLSTVKKNNLVAVCTLKNYRSVCNSLFQVKLPVNELAAYGSTTSPNAPDNMAQIKELTLDKFIDLIDKSAFDHCIFSKFGHYITQSPADILQTKLYDLYHNHYNTLNLDKIATINNSSNICFWALKRLNLEGTRKNLQEMEKNSCYVIMPYTTSKNQFKKDNNTASIICNKLNKDPHDSWADYCKNLHNEQNNSSIITYYSLDHNKKTRKEKIPTSMIPPIATTSEKIYALLISEFFYLDPQFTDDVQSIYPFFHSIDKKGNIKELVTTFLRYTGKPTSCSHTCAKLKDRNNLIEYLKKFNTKTVKNDSNDKNAGDTAFLIAKLEYPYIIALH